MTNGIFREMPVPKAIPWQLYLNIRGVRETAVHPRLPDQRRRLALPEDPSALFEMISVANLIGMLLSGIQVKYR